MAELFTNLAKSTLAAGIAAGDTQLTVAATDGAALFPELVSPDFFRCVLYKKATGDVEVIIVTARAGDNFTTIARAQEDIGNITATAFAFDAGDIIELRPTAAFYASIGAISIFDIQSSSYNYSLDQGSKNAPVIQLNPIPASYFSPGRYMILMGHSNDAPATLWINGVAGGPKNIKRPDGNVLQTGDLVANTIADVAYDGTGDYVLLNPRSSALPGTWAVDGLVINEAAYFGAIENHGSVTTSPENIDFSLANKHFMILEPAAGDDTSLTFTPTPGPSDFRLTIQQDAVGGRTVTWPANCLFAGGGTPILSTAAGARDIASMYYGGTHYHVAMSYDWS
jgi:hypothetical protein